MDRVILHGKRGRMSFIKHVRLDNIFESEIYKSDSSKDSDVFEDFNEIGK